MRPTILAPRIASAVVMLGTVLGSSAGCSSNPWTARHSCIPATGVAAMQPLFELTADLNADRDQAPAGETRMARDECYRKEYVRRGYRWLYLANPKDATDGASLLRRDLPRALKSAECLVRGEELSAQLGFSYVSPLIHAYQDRFGIGEWDDPDYGPVQSLTCAASAHDEDLGTFLSRLNNGLSLGPCVELARRSEAACFHTSMWAQDVVERAPGPVDLSSLTDARARQFLAEYQAILVRGSGAFGTVVKNLAAAAVDTDVSAERLRKGTGTPAPVGVLMLELTMNLAAGFVADLHDQAAYSVLFGPHGTDHDTIVDILGTGEASLAGWFAALQDKGVAPTDAMLKLRERYQQTRTRAGI